MIAKVRSENEWLYYANVDFIKALEHIKEGEKITIAQLYIFQKDVPRATIIELNGAVAYLLNEEGKTIERIN